MARNPISPAYSAPGPMYPGPYVNSRHTALSYQAAASGDQHRFTRYIGPEGVSLHPWQRMGAVSANASAASGRMNANGWDSYGGGPYVPPIVTTWPPVLNPIGSPRDPAMQV